MGVAVDEAVVFDGPAVSAQPDVARDAATAIATAVLATAV
jgi:hypothetical protein